MQRLSLLSKIRQVVGDAQVDAGLNVRCMSQTLLCFYTGTMMQPLYAGLFKGLSGRMSWTTSYLRFRQSSVCQNQGLVDVLSKNMARPAQG